MNNSLCLATMIVQMKNSFARKTFQFTLLAQPILYTFITYYMFIYSEIDNYISYVVLGSGLLSLWSCIVFSSAGDIERERWMGTLAILFVAPASFPKIILSKIIGNTILSLLPFIISFLIVRFIFLEPFIITHFYWFLFIFLLSIISFVAIAFLFSVFFTLSKKAGSLMNCMEYPIFILCGMAFPLSMIPEPFHFISYLLTPTYATQLLRSSINGIENLSIFYLQIGLLILLSIIYIVLGILLFHKIDKKIRQKATLEVC